jgi:hypothetical protein
VTAMIIPFEAAARPLRGRGGSEVTPLRRSPSTESRPAVATQCANAWSDFATDGARWRRHQNWGIGALSVGDL